MRYPRLITLSTTLAISLSAFPPPPTSATPLTHHLPTILDIPALPPHPFPANPNHNHTNFTTAPNPSTRTVECFKPTTPYAVPLQPDACSAGAIDLLLHTPGLMEPRTYSWHARVPGSFGIPANWVVQGCEVVLTAGLAGAVDRFGLVEVVVVAQRILDECVAGSKYALGGLGLVGNQRGLFVTVNGPGLPGGVERG